MKRLLLIGFLAVGIGGCSHEEVYHPNFSASQPQSETVKPPAIDAPILTKVGNNDYSRYGIPLYPGAKIVPGSDVKSKAKKDTPAEFHISFESGDHVSALTDWYKQTINPTQGFGSKEVLGTMAGTTKTGLPVYLTIASVQAKTIVTISVDEAP